jgi:hypothetical protein
MPNLTDTDLKYQFLKPPADERQAPSLVVEPPTTASADDPFDLQNMGPGRPVSGRVGPSNVMSHQEAHPVVLDIMMTKKYGPEWLGWEGETIEHRVPQDFRSSISLLNLSKLQAMRTLHLVDAFWQRWEVFCWCCMPLNDIFPDFEVMQVPTVAQCMVAVDIANRTRDDMQWSSEVREYLSVVHRHDELLVPQAPLDFVRVDTEGFPIDVPDILKRWQDVRVSGRVPADETVEDEQLRRMLMAYQALEASRSILRLQLKEVLNA